MCQYNVIGVMSGTSLDGLDIILCNIDSQNWSFNLLKSSTVKYTKEWFKKLSSAQTLNGYDLTVLHKEFGQLIGNSIINFLKGYNGSVDAIASHGHTVFHQPEKKLTLQIGDGHEIAAITGIKTICDFRALDVALGGQGAPLVPVGDNLLFPEYDYCLNLGGFANISFKKNNERLAFDICPVNIILNYLANKLGHSYDKNGALGVLGAINNLLLEKLNLIDYYSMAYPKSLGKEWLDTEFIPIVDSFDISLHDKIKTVYEHIAVQISTTVEGKASSKTLITGGGAFNKLLVNLIKQKTATEIIIPENEIIEYKEALIFALLGVLKLENKINCLSSVTGANKDSSSGLIFNP